MRASHYLARARLACKREIPSSETLCNFQYFQVFPVNATEFRSYVGITSAFSPMFVLPVGAEFCARNVARRLFHFPFRDSEEFVTSRTVIHVLSVFRIEFYSVCAFFPARVLFFRVLQEEGRRLGCCFFWKREYNVGADLLLISIAEILVSSLF